MLRNSAWIIWLGIITYLSNRRISNLPKIQFLQIEGIDKVVHAIFYFVLVLLMTSSSIGKTSAYKHRRESMIVVFALLWGLLMEILQATVFTYRSAEWLDLVANGSGALLGMAAIHYFNHLKKGL